MEYNESCPSLVHFVFNCSTKVKNNDLSLSVRYTDPNTDARKDIQMASSANGVELGKFVISKELAVFSIAKPSIDFDATFFLNGAFC